MPRINKRSRLKGLTPKLYLQAKDSHTGSYPSRILTTSEGLQGNYRIYWDDTNTIIFTQSKNIVFGPNVEKDFLQKTIYNEIFGNDLSTSLSSGLSYLNATGSIRKGISDVFISFTPGSPYKPFKDTFFLNDSIKNNEFYATGSKIEDIGEGFKQPLWAKTKIEIDLTPSQDCSHWMTQGGTTGSSYPMSYWNKDLKVWEGIGNGKRLYDYFVSYPYLTSTKQLTSGTFKQFVEETCIGFCPGQSYVNDDGLLANQPAHPNSTFGFPTHIKYHATSSNTILMSDYISRPFLLEKIKLEISCALKQNTFSNISTRWGTVTNFFILNQRKNSKLNLNLKEKRLIYTTGKLTASNEFYDVFEEFDNQINIPSSSNEVHNGLFINTNRDLVTYAQIGCANIDFYYTQSINEFNDELTRKSYQALYDFYTSRDYVININTNGISWSQNLTLLNSCKVGNKTAGDACSVMDLSDQNAYVEWPATELYLSKQNFGRNLLNNKNPRDYLNTMKNYNILYSYIRTENNTTSQITNVTLNSVTEDTDIIPYLLIPSDELILGWQVPIAFNFLYNTFFFPGRAEELYFPAKPAKITLYGSYISEGKELHNDTTELLTSNVIHEVIGED